MDADDFLDQIVAHGRVAAALNELRRPCTQQPFGSRQRRALGDLLADLRKGSAYVEEANRLGAASVLTRVMRACPPDDERALDDAAAAIALCSGPMACAGRLIAFDYGNGARVAIHEAPLGDGLGARVWAIAHAFCRLLATDAARRSLVQGRHVLEIGAGTGVVGIAAAKLGAARVVLTDNEPAVLANLRACVHLNAGSGADDGSSSGGGGEGAGGGAGPASQDTTSMLQAAKAERAWQAANMEVRLLEWADDLAAHDGGGGSGEQQQQVEEQQQQQQEQAESDSGALPPRVDANERFPLLLGNETMYEPEHATLVAAVIARRLARGGLALLCSAVRFREVFAAFEAACAARGLRHRSAPIAPAKGDADGGILRDDYDGGFRLMAVDWADAHASPNWAPEPGGWQ